MGFTSMLAWSTVVVLVAAGCGTDVSGSSGSPNSHRISPFDVVPLASDLGDGVATEVAGARVMPDGSVQLLVEGGSCLRPTRVPVEEGTDSVTVSAFAADVSAEGDCTMEIVPWFVRVELRQPLGSRTVVSGSGNELQVVDCRENGEHPWCGKSAV
jgi:hypothetical protein